MTRRFRFGICTDQNMTWEKTVERWQLFERLGYESAWLCDHLVQPSRPQGPYFEAWTLLGGLAAVTKTIRVGVLVTSNTFRYPQVLAKMAVTVDHISNGRLEIGLGAGWYEPEHTMFGIEFPETKELVSRFREAVQVVDLMTREDTSSFDGVYYKLKDARSRPASVQKPRPPLVLGAFGPRMLKIVARYADTWNAFGTAQEMRERNQMLDDYCREIGRDPDTLDRRGPVGFEGRLLQRDRALRRGGGQPVHLRPAARRSDGDAGMGRGGGVAQVRPGGAARAGTCERREDRHLGLEAAAGPPVGDAPSFREGQARAGQHARRQRAHQRHPGRPQHRRPERHPYAAGRIHQRASG